MQNPKIILFPDSNFIFQVKPQQPLPVYAATTRTQAVFSIMNGNKFAGMKTADGTIVIITLIKNRNLFAQKRLCLTEQTLRHKSFSNKFQKRIHAVEVRCRMTEDGRKK